MNACRKVCGLTCLAIWARRDGDDLAALAGDDQGAVAALQAQVLDVRAGRLRDPRPVEGEQGDQRYGRCHPVEDAIRNSEMEGLHVNADPLADSGEFVTRACARYGLA